MLDETQRMASACARDWAPSERRVVVHIEYASLHNGRMPGVRGMCS